MKKNEVLQARLECLVRLGDDTQVVSTIDEAIAFSRSVETCLQCEWPSSVIWRSDAAQSEADAGLFWDAFCIWLSQHDLLLEVRPTNYD